MDTMIGTVQAFAFNFTPRGWMPCDGRLLQISEYSTLYSLLGDQYGGDRHTTFALPDLRDTLPKGKSNSGYVGKVESVGSGEGVKTLQLNYCICVEGMFPSRS